MASTAINALDLLKADHREVEKLFAEFDEAEGDTTEQAAIASRIGQALSIHAELEEAILYPRIMKPLGDDADLVCEATVEHGTLHGLIADMNGKDPSDPMVKAHVVVLKEYVKHHVREEENELFPKVEKTGLDLEAIGEEILALKRALQAQVGRRANGGGAKIHVTEVHAAA